MELEPWAEDLTNEYLTGPDAILPAYLKNVAGPMREFYPSDESKYQEVLTNLPFNERKTKYNAFEKDISAVNIYFGKPTTIEYKRMIRMTNIDFISAVGG